MRQCVDSFFYGDSFTAGQGATTPLIDAWPALLSANRLYSPNNNGVGGQTIVSGSGNVFDASTIISKTPYLQRLYSSWGINDSAVAGKTSTDFTNAYSAFFTAAISKGWAYSDMVVISKYLLSTFSISSLPNYSSYSSALETLCTSLGVKFINTEAYMLANGGQSLLWQNGVGGSKQNHPNDSGNIAIATYIESQL